MKRLSRHNLENMGAKVFEDYSRLPELAHTPIRSVDPPLLCKRLLGLSIEYRTLSKRGNILGMTAFEPVNVVLPSGLYHLDGRTVLIDDGLKAEWANIGRRNFTIVHEASHQLLKMFFPRDYGRGPECRVYCCRADTVQRPAINNWEEWQTNTLASAVLMPRALIFSAMEAVGLKGKIHCLNRLFAREEFEKFTAISETLGVSKKALSIRMGQLGLIGEDFLGNPYGMIDVEVD